MRVLVTGGSGRVGKWVVADLLEAGHEVAVFDQKPPASPDVEFHNGSILSLHECQRACRGMNAVIHLAAIPSPLHDTAERVLHVNTTGAWNIHQAAVDAEVPRVVHASSDATYGYVFRQHDIPLDYLPINEDYPQRPQDPYGSSKMIGEQIAKKFSEEHDLQTVALRICWVWMPDEPENYRKFTEDPDAWSKGLWVYNDARDVAQAFRLSLDAPNIRCERFCISAADNGTDVDTLELVRKHYGEVKVRQPIEGRRSPIDCSLAAKQLGYEPQHSWRDWVRA
jgi:nucleoside-diphosphate-sugar epimerase